MRTYISVVMSVMIGVAALPAATQAQANAGCSGDSASARMYRDGYGGMVSREGSERNRTNAGLPTISNEQVTIVSDTTICRIASAAYDSAVGSYALPGGPVVLKIGSTGYVVIKGFEPRGAYRHYRMNVLFNQDFTVAKKRIWY
jgi:hypothetical protein